MSGEDDTRESPWCGATATCLMSMAEGYPAHPSLSQKTAARRFIKALPLVLPCEASREAAAEVVKLMPEGAVDSREDMKRLVRELCRRVNFPLQWPPKMSK